MKVFLLKFYTILIVVTWFLGWLLLSYMSWELLNPFQWLINMPTYDSNTRGTMLFWGLAYLGCAGCIVGGWLDSTGKFKKGTNSQPDMKLRRDYYDKYHSTELTSNEDFNRKEGTSVTDIALGVGLGVVGVDILTDVFE